MKTLIERVQELMDTMKWDAEKVAAVAGVTSSAVYQWLGSGKKTIHTIGKLEAAIKLERASGFSAMWLAKGQGPKMASAVGERPATVRDMLQFHLDFLAQLSPLDQTLAQTAFRHFLEHPEDVEAVVNTLEGLASGSRLGGSLPKQADASRRSA